MLSSNKMSNNKDGNDKWGYVVCFGTIVTFVAGIGHVNSFGLIYNDFIKTTNSTTKSLTTAHGMFAVMIAFGGIILNIIARKKTLQFGGILGAILFILGSFMTMFITDISQLIVTFGILQGIGFGIMTSVCYFTVNHYFVKRRTTVMGVVKAVQGILQMVYPQLVKIIISFYGFRGTLLILSGISLHTSLGMFTMKICNAIPKKRAANVKNAVNRSENVDLINNDENLKAGSSLGSNDNVNWLAKIGHELAEVLKLNAKFVKDPVYCNICVGQSLVNFSDLTFFMLLPMLLFQYGYDESRVATFISICAGADVAGRFALAVISSLVDVNTRTLFYFATLGTFIMRIALLQVQQYIWLSVLGAALGILRAWLHVCSPLVIASYVAHDDFPGAYALLMLTTGMVNVAFGPAIGFLKDFYADFTPTFYALTACCVPCLVLWPLEHCNFARQNSIRQDINCT